MEQNTLTKKSEIQEINFLNPEDQFVSFILDEYNFAVPVGIVERIVRSVIITPIPGTPENVLGVVNVQGQVIPVFNIRKIFGLSSGEIQLSDQLIIAHTSRRTISFVADMVTGVTNRLEQKIVPADNIFPGLEKIIEGLIFFEDGMILIYDLEKLFTLESIEVINLALMEKEKAKAKAKAEAKKKIKDKSKKIKVDKPGTKTE
jgi:purine-binding chemotaxis protein CheW